MASKIIVPVIIHSCVVCQSNDTRPAILQLNLIIVNQDAIVCDGCDQETSKSVQLSKKLMALSYLPESRVHMVYSKIPEQF